jgi:hypothetical protein
VWEFVFLYTFDLVVKFGSFCPDVNRFDLRTNEFVSGLRQQTAIKPFFLNYGAGIRD